MGTAIATDRRTRLLDLLICLVLGGLCLVAYGRAFSADFVPFDDDIQVTTNPHIQSLSLQNLSWMFSDTSLTQRYTPLSWIVWASLYHFWGLKPAAFHAEAVAVHLINAVLVFFLIRAILRRTLATGYARRTLSLASGCSAALWAMHPLRVEVVAWVTQVRFAEAALFLMTALLLYLAAVDRSPAKPYRTPAFWLSVVAFAASVLFYPSGIGLILLLPLLDIYPLHRVSPQTARWRDLGTFAMEKAPFALPAIFLAIMTIYGRFAAAVPGGMWASPVTLAQFGLADRVMQAAYILAHYLWKPFDCLHICPVYATLVHFNPFSAPFLLSLLAVIGLTTAAILYRRRCPQFTVLWAAHLALLLPVGGYFEHPHFPSDRYSYLQGILFSIIVAAALAWAWRGPRLRVRLPVFVLTAAVITSLTGLSSLQTATWRNGESLYRHILAELGDDPCRVAIYWRLGELYMNRGDLNNTFENCDRALALVPRHPDVLLLKGTALTKLAEQGRANNQPPDVLAPTYRQAAQLIEASIEIQPSPEGFDAAGLAHIRLGDLAVAIRDYTKAIELKPGWPEAYNNRGVVYAGMGNYEQAVRDCTKAIELKPDLVDAYDNRASLHCSLKQYDKAWADVKMCRQLGRTPNPDVVRKLIEATGRTE